jgi:DNA modification methylase
MAPVKIIEYIDKYAGLVTFNPNKLAEIHRWYPFVEGYSSDLVKSIISEQSETPELCLDPFGGVGTTSLTCQSLGISCISVESNPFFYDIAKTKLSAKNFSPEELLTIITKLETSLSEKKKKARHPELESKTFFQNSSKVKWVFHRSASNAIFDIIDEINVVCINGLSKYKSLLKLCLAAMLPEISNVFRNGKCLSYKKNWEIKRYSRKQVHNYFIKQVKDVVLADLNKFDHSSTVDNSNGNLILGDVRTGVTSNGKKIDLVVTSPPYLNSRDYTDVYRLELWMLGYVDTFEKERKLRNKALTSHVQVARSKVGFPNVPELHKAIKYLEKEDTKLWNKHIPNMVRGYFNDMQKLLLDLKSKLNNNARLFINVSNSSYANHIIEVDRIIAKSAELIGYECEEIRVARYIKTSSQQHNVIDMQKMRESIIVLKLKHKKPVISKKPAIVKPIK